MLHNSLHYIFKDISIIIHPKYILNMFYGYKIGTSNISSLVWVHIAVDMKYKFSLKIIIWVWFCTLLYTIQCLT